MTIDNVKLVIKSATGVDIGEEHDNMLVYLCDSETKHILNDCNRQSIPNGLLPMLEKRVAGLFMQMNKALFVNEEDLTSISSIKEGDTTVTFGEQTAEGRFDTLVNEWLDGWERDVACYRKLKW